MSCCRKPKCRTRDFRIVALQQAVERLPMDQAENPDQHKTVGVHANLHAPFQIRHTLFLP